MRTNKTILEKAVKSLDDLVNDVVFVGGAITELLLTQQNYPGIRITQDVDLIIDVVNLNDYYKFSEKLRQKGFYEDREIICRWIHKANNITIDVMATDEKIIGFSNRWYKEAIKNNFTTTIAGIEIKVISPIYFLATKFVAFHDRGNSDVYTSHDLEDIICVIDGRDTIIDEINNAANDVKMFLKTEFSNLLNNEDFHNVLPGLIYSFSGSDERFKIILDRIQQISLL